MEHDSTESTVFAKKSNNNTNKIEINIACLIEAAELMRKAKVDMDSGATYSDVFFSSIRRYIS